jgi:hypothetical protein
MSSGTSADILGYILDVVGYVWDKLVYLLNGVGSGCNIPADIPDILVFEAQALRL